MTIFWQTQRQSRDCLIERGPGNGLGIDPGVQGVLWPITVYFQSVQPVDVPLHRNCDSIWPK